MHRKEEYAGILLHSTFRRAWLALTLSQNRTATSTSATRSKKQRWMWPVGSVRGSWVGSEEGVQKDLWSSGKQPNFYRDQASPKTLRQRSGA